MKGKSRAHISCGSINYNDTVIHSVKHQAPTKKTSIFYFIKKLGGKGKKYRSGI